MAFSQKQQRIQLVGGPCDGDELVVADDAEVLHVPMLDDLITAGGIDLNFPLRMKEAIYCRRYKEEAKLVRFLYQPPRPAHRAGKDGA